MITLAETTHPADWVTVTLIILGILVLLGLILFINWLTGKTARERGEKKPPKHGGK